MEQLGIVATLLIIITEDLTADQVNQLADQLADQYRRHGITMHRRLHTTQVSHGASWRNIDDGTTGLVDDPEVSDAALHSQMSGGQPNRDRDQMRADVERTTTEYTGEDHLAEYDALVRLTAAVTTGAATELLSEGGRLAKSLAAHSAKSGHFRDLVLDLARQQPAESAHVLTELARYVRGTERGILLTPAAVAAYLTGNGGRARIILETAAASGELTRMGTLLEQVLDAGLPPTELAAVIKAAVEG